MKQLNVRNRTRLALENLESRWCPAIAWSNVNDVLTVTGDPVSLTGELTVTQTAAGVYSIADGVTTLATLVNANKGVSITLDGDNDTVFLNGAAATPITGNVSVNTGNGNDTVAIANGGGGLTIAGMLLINTGNGDDTVGLDTGGGTLTVQGFTSVSMGAGLVDALDVNPTTTIQGDLTVQGASGATSLIIDGDVQGRVTIVYNEGIANTATIGTTSVLGSLSMIGSAGAETVTLNGEVQGAASFSLSNGTNGLTTGAASQVEGTLTYNGGSGIDNVQLSGEVQGSLIGNLGSSTGVGNDFDMLGTASVDGAVTLTADGGVTNMMFAIGTTVAGNLSVTTRSTTNTFVMNGIMGGGRFTYTGGGAVDTVTWNAASGAAYLSANLGSGNDVFNLNSANYNRGVIDGSFGTADDFTNAVAAIGLTVRGFEL